MYEMYRIQTGCKSCVIPLTLAMFNVIRCCYEETGESAVTVS